MVLLLLSFCRGWVEGICGVNVFNLVFLLFEEENLKILILDLHILYRSLYIVVQVQREDGLGELCLQVIKSARRVFKNTLYSLHTDITILLQFLPILCLVLLV